MSWQWSDNPNDWAQQITAIFTAAAALFTGVYVWLTYRLMKATSRTAEIAFRETQRDRIERLMPIKRTLEELRKGAATMSHSIHIETEAARIAAVLSRVRYDLDAHAEVALYITDELSSALSLVREKVEAAFLLGSSVIGNEITSGSQTALTEASLGLSRAIDVAMACVLSELTRTQRIVYQN
jgi:hypothetical protein